MTQNRYKRKWGEKHEQPANAKPGTAVQSGSWSDSVPDGVDTVALSQYLETRGAQSELQPEKKLMFAMLQDAIDCFRKNLFASGDSKTALFQEAEEWILAEGDSYLFSFDSICEVLDINPAYLRRGLMNYKRAEQSRRAA